MLAMGRDGYGLVRAGLCATVALILGTILSGASGSAAVGSSIAEAPRESGTPEIGVVGQNWVVNSQSRVGLLGSIAQFAPQTRPVAPGNSTGEWVMQAPLVLPSVELAFGEVYQFTQVGAATGTQDTGSGVMTFAMSVRVRGASGAQVVVPLHFTTEHLSGTGPDGQYCNAGEADPTFCNGTRWSAVTRTVRLVAIAQIPEDSGTSADQELVLFEISGMIDAVLPDEDGDGIPDEADNCPNWPNPTQADLDGDGLGDPCDTDDDGDGSPATLDCDDRDANYYPGAPDYCGNGRDEDCDGADAACPVCASPTLDPSGWTLLYVDSEETAQENGRGTQAIDGNPSTKWHTRYTGGATPYPHELRFDLGGVYALCGLGYLPRQDGGQNGIIRGYQLALSDDGESWVTVSQGDLGTFGPLNSERIVEFTPMIARYVRFRGLSEINGGPWAAAAEIRIRGGSTLPQLAPFATIELPTLDIDVASGASVEFAGTGVDPDGDLPLTFAWSFPTCASPSSSTLEDPGLVVFNCASGSYEVTFEVCDAEGLCASDARDVTIGGTGCSALPRSGWSVLFADSQETSGENGLAIHAIDGNPSTKWTTRWTPSSPGHPHEIWIDTGVVRTLCGFTYLPRQDGGINGTIRGYEFAVSSNALTWTTVSIGELFATAANLTERAVNFTPISGRFVRLRSLSEVQGGPWASAAEIGLRVTGGPPQSQPPVASITSPAADVSIEPGASVSFAGSGSDPDSQLPLTYSWTFPACATPASASVANPGPVVFGCASGQYPVTFAVCDTAGLCASAQRTVTVLAAGCDTLARAGWTVTFVDSQETSGENGAGVNAIDGSSATIWHTRWSGSNPPVHPHEIRIDTGAPRTLCGFTYLPRQDGGTNGTIKNYEFAVSQNGSDWTTVSSGVLVGTSSDKSPRSVEFSATAARHVRLRALSAANGGPYASAAELGLKATASPPPIAPIVSIQQPGNDPSISPGEAVTFASTATDPDGPAPLAYDWSFPACATPANSALEDPGAVAFNCLPGTYPVTLDVCDAAGHCSTAGRIVTVLGPPCEPLSRAGWSVAFVDSQETTQESGAAIHAIDGNPLTVWHTRWSGSNPPNHPHEIRLDTGAIRTFCGFTYLPRQDGGFNGTIRDYEFAVSTDGSTWTPVVSGTLFATASNLTERSVEFPATTGRFLRLRTLSAVNDGRWATAAEIGARAMAVPVGPLPPVASIDLPASEISVASGAVVAFAGSGSDPDGELPLSYAWTFPACAVPVSSVAEDPGPVSFDCAPGSYEVSFAVCDAGGRCATDERTIQVLGACTVQPQTGWSLVSVSSQETIGENSPAAQAFDGNPATFWHSRWSGSNPPAHPHEIRIDTGALRTLCGFHYLPRQDGGTNGTIKDYEFAVSTDGTTWTTVASGVLIQSPTASSERIVEFAPRAGRYLRLRALSEVRGNRWASAAEIRVRAQ